MDVFVNVTAVPAQTVSELAVKFATGGLTAPTPIMVKSNVDSSQSFVPNETVPFTVPAAVGEKTTLKVVDPPAGTVVVPNVLPRVNPVPLTAIGPVNVKLLVPVLFIVNVDVTVDPTLTLPTFEYPPSRTVVPDWVTFISPGVVALNLKLSM